MKMKEDNLYFGEKAREKLMTGVHKVAEAVGMTLGTSGRNSLIECLERPGHYSTNDGYSIANAVKLSDPLEEIGRSILVEAINRANKSSGDGSSTTCVLTAAILEEGMKHLGEASPMEIKSSLEKCIPVIERSITAQKKEVTTENVKEVASISAEDEGIGEMIQEIYQKIGKEGIIQWDISRKPEDSYEIGTGIRIFDASYITSYMCDLNAKGQFMREAKLTNPHVLLVKKKVSSVELDPICQKLFEMGERQLLVFCDEMDVHVIGDLLNLQMKNGFRTVVVKMPILWREEWWDDLEAASGGKAVSAVSPQVKFENLGRFGNVKVTKEETIIEGTENLDTHIFGIKFDGKGSDESLQRAARLNLKTARYFVGAHSESALAYRRLKVEDAINSASCALENGVVSGGGVAFRIASDELPKDEIGGIILKEALQKPYCQILDNAEIKGQMLPSYQQGFGFNSRTRKIVNMSEAGIVDPCDVVLEAVRNAIGVAASILTIGTVITLPREEEQTNSPPIR